MDKPVNKLRYCLTFVVLAGGFLYLEHMTSDHTKLSHFHFSSSEDEMAGLLGVSPSDDMHGQFNLSSYTTSVVDDLEVKRIRRHGAEKWEFDLDCTIHMNRNVMRSRAMALRQGPAGASSLDFQTPNGSFDVDPDVCRVSGDDLASPEVANAFWPLALYVIYGSPMPTAAQIAMLNEKKPAGKAPHFE